MNLNKIILGIQLIAISVVECSFRARGNMRPAVTFASGLSPMQMKIIKLMMQQKCIRQRKRHGRFSKKICWFKIENRVFSSSKSFLKRYNKQNKNIWFTPRCVFYNTVLCLLYWAVLFSILPCDIGVDHTIRSMSKIVS